MKDAAAIAAQVVDIRNDDRHKGFIKVTIHCPVEHGDLLREAIPWATYTNPVPVALAVLNPEREAASNRTAQSTASPPAPEEPELPPARAPLGERVRKMCGVKLFQRYLHENHMIDLTATEPTPFIQAKAAVKLICSVEHTAEIKRETYAAAKWDELYARFLVWRDTPDLVA